MSKEIRLACVCCDREDRDGITAEELSEAVARGGWRGVGEAAEEATGWWTHLGICPECATRRATA